MAFQSAMRCAQLNSIMWCVCVYEFCSPKVMIIIVQASADIRVKLDLMQCRRVCVCARARGPNKVLVTAILCSNSPVRLTQPCIIHLLFIEEEDSQRCKLAHISFDDRANGVATSVSRLTGKYSVDRSNLLNEEDSHTHKTWLNKCLWPRCIVEHVPHIATDTQQPELAHKYMPWTVNAVLYVALRCTCTFCGGNGQERGK